MDQLKVLCPTIDETAYRIATEEFCRLYGCVTNHLLPIITEDDGESDLVVIGCDAVNRFAAKLIFTKHFDGFKFRYGTDGYQITSVCYNDRKILLIAGGQGRSTLYAVYHFFEVQAGCRYFWDGDIIPKKDSVPITGLHIIEEPRFDYRGIRYFAHRGLHRFQAEHWGFEDWKKEIDWMLKKRLNLFMLRIGHDDVFQKAFPDIVDYPPANGRLPEAESGYDNRTLFWPLEYRGELRKKVLDYAFERGLLHPEDCGAITHWYTRTPIQYLEKAKPKLLSQKTTFYTEKTALVWDIREDENMENYFKLTKAHIEYYGKSNIFHTIGLAERSFSDNRDDNLKLKLYTYRRIVHWLKTNYPNSPLLIASWDLWMFYTPDEVKKLISELDPNQSIILDYTSDTVRQSNFTNWGIVGEFPWIFGIFHGYAPNSDIRGNYSLLEQRLRIAKEDTFCKGLVLWPELSHSDTFMSEYMTYNSWSPLRMTLDEHVIKYCDDRYLHASASMKDIWRAFIPIVQLMSWSMDDTTEMPKEYFFDIFSLLTFDESSGLNYETLLVPAEKYRKDAIFILKSLAELYPSHKKDELFRRDVFDIARTVCGRYIHFALVYIKKQVNAWKNGQNTSDKILAMLPVCTNLLELLSQLLGQHTDYSLYHTLEKLKQAHPVNPLFEDTLKDNVSCSYCRSYIFENIEYLYLPEMRLMFEFIKQSIRDENRNKWIVGKSYLERIEEIKTNFYKMPLFQMNLTNPKPVAQILQTMASTIKRLSLQC